MQQRHAAQNGRHATTKTLMGSTLEVAVLRYMQLMREVCEAAPQSPHASPAPGGGAPRPAVRGTCVAAAAAAAAAALPLLHSSTLLVLQLQPWGTAHGLVAPLSTTCEATAEAAHKADEHLRFMRKLPCVIQPQARPAAHC